MLFHDELEGIFDHTHWFDFTQSNKFTYYFGKGGTKSDSNEVRHDQGNLIVRPA
jgi:hypothetical protein